MIHWFLSAVIAISSVSQNEGKGLKYIIAAGKVGGVKEYVTKESTRKLTYLGPVKVNGKVAYHVVAEFRRLKMAITWRGYSHVIFCTDEGKVLRSYDFGMPDELPSALRNNVLYQKYKEDKRTVVDSIRLNKTIPGDLVTAGNRKLYEGTGVPY